ncbi:methyltransferase 1 [Seminavis robusta]|uniref:DNA (cytosine-5-)-methyltransferase n=1 Tax=Seminavis robusta TaxID=568900 RepID=A0A9N8HBD6_9STRA|nr:methyltransferase 1 [Seminavis robusta]|eukprot:Sro357_g125700.1 methyltransferase 1 (803) ;mRNA; r:49616-52126
MDPKLSKVLNELRIPEGEHSKLVLAGITNYETLKAKQYQLDRQQLALVDSAAQNIVAAALVYLDTLECDGNPLTLFKKTDWIRFAVTVGAELSEAEGPSHTRGGGGDSGSGARALGIVLDSDKPAETKDTAGDVVMGDAMEVDEALADEARQANIGSVRVARGPREKGDVLLEDDEDGKNDDEDAGEDAGAMGKFDLMDQGFNPKEASLFDIAPEKEASNEKGSQLDFVDFGGRRFHKGKCYYYKDPDSEEGIKNIVGIKSFRTVKEANCVGIVHTSKTFLGQEESGDFAKKFAQAVSKHYSTEFVQVRGTKRVPLSELVQVCLEPSDIPRLIYEPRTNGNTQSLGYVRDNDGRNLVRVPRKQIRLVEGFSGAGGMHLGYEAEGYATAMAIEYNPVAVKTFRHNNPGVAVYNGDIREFIRKVREEPEYRRKELREKELGPIDVIHTSSPCQGFSRANRYGGVNDDANNKLSFTYPELLELLDAKVGVFENVEGMWSVKGMPYLREILIRCIDLGYQVRFKILRSCDYGDPQKRPRLIIIAAKNYVQMPDHPSPTHGPRKKPYVYPKDVMEYLRTPAGKQYPNSALTSSRTEVSPECERLQEKRFAPAMKASGCAVLHYEEKRCITVREAAALQSFPYDYEFLGSATDQQRQVGNAVPVELSRAIARSVRESLRLQYVEEFETNSSSTSTATVPEDTAMEEEQGKGEEKVAEHNQAEPILEESKEESLGDAADDTRGTSSAEMAPLEEESDAAAVGRQHPADPFMVRNIGECKEECFDDVEDNMEDDSAVETNGIQEGKTACV